MDVRVADLDDERAVSECVAAAYRPFVEEIGRTPAPMLDDYGELIRAERVDVIGSPGDIAGVVVHWREADHWYVDNLAVDPGRQGKGIGRSLVEHACRAGRDSGCSELRLYTNQAMAQNQTWYPSLGFVETHRGNDRGYSRIFYRLTL